VQKFGIPNFFLLEVQIFAIFALMLWLINIWLFLVLLMFAPSVLAQTQVKGFVKQGNLPAAGATVSLDKKYTLTDSSGFYSFSSFPPGKYTIHVSMVGYEAFHKTLVVAQNETRAIDIELMPQQSSLDAVVITGTMKPVKKLESPVAVEVYSPQFFRKNPSPSIFESLQNVNGVRPQINCSVCNTGDIHINGLEGPYTMVTIDGMPIVSSLSSVYGLFGIPSELIDRVEIVKGPASGLYGSEAIGGLINIITRSPSKAPLFSASLMSTSWQEHSADLGVKWKLKKWQSLLGLNYFNYNKAFDKNNDFFTDVTLQHRISVFYKWSMARKNNKAASLAARYFYENRWGGDMRFNKSFRGGDSIYGESIYTKRWELIGNYELPLVEKISFSFSATGHNQDSYYGIVPYMAKQNILFGQMLWDKPFQKHNLLFGLAGRYNYYDDNSTATEDTMSGKNLPEKYFLPGLFAQDEWKLDTRHTLLFGLRIDHHPAHGKIITPRLAYKWSWNNKQVLRLNAGTGFRVVNIFTEDHAALTGARIVEIKEKLRPEKSYNVNINYSHQFGSHSRYLNVDASAWYSFFHNQIIANYLEDPNKIIYENLKGHAISKGITINLEGNILQRFKAIMGITLQDVSKVEIINGKKQRSTPLLTESLSGTWSLSYTIPVHGLSFDYTGNIYGPMELPLVSTLDPREKNSPVWSIQNIQLTKWISQNMEVFGGIKNLLNWTPAKKNPFIIARTHDPFDKKLEYDANGKILSTAENPYALSFDPSYIYAPNQGMRAFLGLRIKVK
jgi:outer membrane receptor for ferrienterochelin and colicins